MGKKAEQVPVNSDLILYQAEDGKTKIEVRLQGETVWLTLNQMAELFQVDKSGISRHLKNIYGTGEPMPDATVANFATVQQEGSRSVQRTVEYYKLDDFLKRSGRDILTHAGKISHDKALEKAHAEYEKYRKERLNEPSPVERQFLEAVEEMKHLEKTGKRGRRNGR